MLILQSCYFGAGLVEKEITDDYFLFANNSLDEMSIWFHAEKYSNRLIVPETVFALGENGDFIIAKSTEQSPNLTLEQFENKRKELNIPKNLDFEIVYEELK